MKKLFLFLSLITFSVSIFSQGIAFEENHSLTDALAKAKKENKHVFIDAFATWCGPCKMMAAKIFPLKEVGDYYNAHFINLKLDMEAPENVEIAKKYEVKAYPTYLFLDAEGNVVHKALGGMPAEAFINVAKTALDSENNFQAVAKKIKDGDRTLNTIKKYMDLNPYDEGNGALVENYFKNIPESEIYTPENWELFNNYVKDIDAPSFQYFLQNKEKIAGFIGKEPVEKKLSQVMSGVYFKDPSKENELKKIDPAVFENVKQKVNLSKSYGKFYQNKNDKTAWSGFMEALTPYMSSVSDPVELNQMAWMVYENYKKFNDKKSLQNALNWAKKAYEAAPDKDFIADTYAHLLYDSGKKKDAVKIETKALELAKKAGDSEAIESFTKAIEKFKKKK